MSLQARFTGNLASFIARNRRSILKQRLPLGAGSPGRPIEDGDEGACIREEGFGLGAGLEPANVDDAIGIGQRSYPFAEAEARRLEGSQVSRQPMQPLAPSSLIRRLTSSLVGVSATSWPDWLVHGKDSQPKEPILAVLPTTEPGMATSWPIRPGTD